MIWIVLYIVLALALGAFLILFAKRVRSQAGASELSLSDYISVAGTVLNVVLLLIAVVSLHIAFKAYDDAKTSGAKQEDSLRKQETSLEATRTALQRVLENLDKQKDTLEKSRKALDSSASTAIAQQRLLSESVANSRKQLNILRSQWNRELEQPDLRAALLYPDEPAIYVYNTSKVKPARDGTYQLIAVNLNRKNEKGFQLVQTASTPTGIIRPNYAFLPSQLVLQLTPAEPLAAGNRLFGYLTVGCPECLVDRVYWLFIRYKQEGFFREAANEQHILQKLQPATINDTLDNFLRQKDLKRMPKNWTEFDR